MQPSLRLHPGEAQQKPSLPCMVLSATQEFRSGENILIQGPPQSGRTSLAMDIAYSCASSKACSCQSADCDCTHVTLYKLRVDTGMALLETEQNLKDCSFPLRCFPVPHPDGDHPLQNGTHQKDTYEECSWDPQVLRRIRICSIVSPRDISLDLLSMMGKDSCQHPSHAIIIDDIDKICWNTQGGKLQTPSRNDLPSSAMSIMQLLALAGDTAVALYRIYDRKPHIVVTCNSNISIPMAWAQTHVELGKLETNHRTHKAKTSVSQLPHRVVGTFPATITCMGTPDTFNKNILCSVVSTSSMGLLIEWS